MSDQSKTILIRHGDGREYAVLPKDFHDIYEPQGFVAVRYETSGEPYEPPAKRGGKPKED